MAHTRRQKKSIGPYSCLLRLLPTLTPSLFPGWGGRREIPCSRSRLLGLVISLPWRGGKGGVDFWSTTERSAFGPGGSRLANIPPYTLRSRGHEGQEGPDQAAQAGRVCSGCWAVGARDPSGGLPLGGPGSGASASLPAPHSPDRLKRRGRGLTTSARYLGRDRDRWDQDQRLRIGVAFLEVRVARGLNASPPTPGWEPC